MRIFGEYDDWVSVSILVDSKTSSRHDMILTEKLPHRWPFERDDVLAPHISDQYTLAMVTDSKLWAQEQQGRRKGDLLRNDDSAFRPVEAGSATVE